MAPPTSPGLTRIVLLGPHRRADLTVPENLPVATLQPLLIRHAGPHLPDEGIAHHGWVLRRLDGTVLVAEKSLAAQDVHDGATLVLAPQDQQWPEPEFDDIAEAAAAHARALGTAWTGRHTRATGVLAGAAALAAGLAMALTAGPLWTQVGLSQVGAAVVLLVSGAIVARMGRESDVATLLVAFAYPYAATGAALVATGEARLGPAQLLVGGATVVVTATIAMIATGLALQWHVGALVSGVLVGTVALISMVTTTPTAAAVVAATLLLVSPWLPRTARFYSGLPASVVHMPSTEAPVDEPLPSPARIQAMVRRSDQTLTGLLYGFGTALTGCAVVLAGQSDLSARLLAIVIMLVCALRARSFAALRHRVPLLIAAVVSGLALGVLWWADLGDGRASVVVPGLGFALALAGFVVAMGRAFASSTVSPQVSRIADWIEMILLVLSPVLAAAVAGVFGFARGLGG